MGNNSVEQKSGLFDTLRPFEIGPLMRILFLRTDGSGFLDGVGLGIQGKVPLPGTFGLQMDASYVVRDGEPPIYHEEMTPLSRDVCQKSPLKECAKELAKYARTVRQSTSYQFGVSSSPKLWIASHRWGPGTPQWPVGVLVDWEQTKTTQFGPGGIKTSETMKDTLRMGPKLGLGYRIETTEVFSSMALNVGQAILFDGASPDTLLQTEFEMVFLF